MDPLTPPPELISRLKHLYVDDAIVRAYREGADMELEGCCDWFKSQGYHPEVYRDLRIARRQNPERSAEVALNLLDDISGKINAAHENGIRRALERLQELEDGNV